jgi:hypothetical protein
MQRIFRNIGFVLLLIGGSYYVFPLFNARSRILSLFGEQQQIAAIVSLAVGAVLFGLSFRGKKKEEEKK